MKQRIIFLLLIFAVFSPVMAQKMSTQPHFSPVTALAYKEMTDSVFSAGEDGMVICWNAYGEGDHFQCSDVMIRLLAVNPYKNEIAVYETDSVSTYRVSVWDWTYKNRKYSKEYKDPVTCLAYSAKGTYLMVGTASLKGMNFYYADSGVSKNILSASTGAVTMARTSGTESSLVVYAPSGVLSYYDLKKGTEKAKFSVEPDLEQTQLYNNNLCFAGVKNGTVYTITATTGKTIKTVSAQNALLCSVESDASLCYVESENGTFSVNTFSVEDGKKTLQALSASGTAVAAVKTADGYFFGTKTGDIFSLERTESYEIAKKDPITVPTYTSILDMSVSPDGIGFLLTENAVLKTSGDSGITEYITENTEYTNITASGSQLYFWSKNTRTPVKSIDTTATKNAELTYVYTPSFSIQEFKIFGDKILILEGNSAITIINGTTNMVENRYSGIGFLDAVLINDTELYIGKSAATNPKVPMIMIDTTTGETITLSIKADAVYGFDTNGTALYGQLYTEGKTPTSSIFMFRPATRDYRILWTRGEEITTAFINIIDTTLFTDFDKSQITAMNMATSFRVRVGAVNQTIDKLVKIGNTIFVLNERGTVSAYKAEGYAPLGTYILNFENNLVPVASN